MLSWSMTRGGIGISATPSEDGSALTDEITGSNESRTQSVQHCEHEKRRMQGSSRSMAAFALLGCARNADLSIFAQRQTAGQGQRRPPFQPVVPILLRQAPQGTQPSKKEQARLAGGTRCASKAGRQWWSTTVVSHVNGETTQGKHMQGADQRECIQVSSRLQPGLRTLRA